jgi:hypothetical protein
MRSAQLITTFELNLSYEDPEGAMEKNISDQITREDILAAIGVR